MSTTLFTEALESRTLLSADVSTTLSSAVQLDQTQVRADLLKFRSDMLSNFVLLQNDIMTIKADDVKDATTVLPFINTFMHDIKAMRTELKADLLDQRASVKVDEKVIFNDMKSIRQDRGNHSEESADHTQLLDDRIQLQTDMVAGLSARIKTRQNYFSTLSTDMSAIVTAAQSDPHASAKLISDLQKAVTDKTNALNTMISDLSQIKTDRTQLIADLTVMQSSPG